MMGLAMAWLMAGGVASLASRFALQRFMPEQNRSLRLAGVIHALLADLRRSVAASNHRDFAAQYLGMLSFAGNWLVTQFHQLLIQLVVGGSIYLVTCWLVQAVTSGPPQWLGAYTGDLLFLTGAIAGHWAVMRPRASPCQRP